MSSAEPGPQILFRIFSSVTSPQQFFRRNFYSHSIHYGDALVYKSAKTSAVLCATVGLLVLSLQPAGAQETKEQPDFAKLREQSQPGLEHNQLSQYSGKWQLEITMGSGDRSATSNGRATSYMMLDDRFLWIAYNVGGKAGRVKGSFTVGYDRRNERYSLIAMDTHGTYFVTSHGTKDEETGKIKLYGKDDDPHMKAMGFDKEFAHTIDFRNPEELVVEVYYIDTRTAERKERKAMEFVFTRTE